MLGKFHEISVSTTDIRASVEFYERLGFSQAQTGDTWSHPYGVLTDGRIYIGLHQRSFTSPVLTFVKPGVARYITELEKLGLTVTFRETGDEVFNEVGLRDPMGQPLIVLEARTYSPVDRRPEQTSTCGYFEEFSMPASSFDAAKACWEPLGFVATEESADPYPNLPLTSDHLDVSFHKPRTLDRPILIFREPDMAARIAVLRDLGVSLSFDLPRGLATDANALIETPEGLALLLLSGES